MISRTAAFYQSSHDLSELAKLLVIICFGHFSILQCLFSTSVADILNCMCLLDGEHHSVYVPNSQCLSEARRLRCWHQSSGQFWLPIIQPRRTAVSPHSKCSWPLLGKFRPVFRSFSLNVIATSVVILSVAFNGWLELRLVCTTLMAELLATKSKSKSKVILVSWTSSSSYEFDSMSLLNIFD